jgi:hypothetical protein
MSTWAERLRAFPDDLVITFEYGHPNAPDSPGGQDHLRMHTDGRLELRVLRRREEQHFTARTDPALVRRYAAVLAEVGFPDIELGPLSPGVSFWVVHAETGGQRVHALFARSLYMSREPHGELLRVGSGLVFRIRGPESGLSDRAGVAAWDVQRA